MTTDNKSLFTNLISLAIIGVGYAIPTYGQWITTAGYFALSGAITNWLAIYMLFERVPYLYGSGVIPLHFEEFKLGIKRLIMQQFFTELSIKKFFEANKKELTHNISVDHLIDAVDFELVYKRLVETIMESKFGSMLSMFGSEKALSSLKDPFIQKFHVILREIVETEQFQKALLKESISTEVHQKIESMVDNRLNELTPQMVKEMVQDMIKKHLGWLVVWGGVFGGLIGLILELVTYSRQIL